MKILDNTGLAYFWTKLKGFFAPISHTHTSYAVKHSYTVAANAAKNWYRIANANTSQTDTTKPIHAQFILTAYNDNYDSNNYLRWFINAEVFGRTAHIVIFGTNNYPFSQARILYENTVADLDANDRPALDIYLNYVYPNGATKIEIEEVYNQGWTFVADGQISASIVPTGFENVACDGVRNNGVYRSTNSDYATYASLQRSNFTANFTLADNNTYRAKVLNCTGTITVTVPSLNSAWSWFIIKNFNTTSGVITIHPSTTSVLIDGSNADIKLQPGEYIMIHSKAANAYTIVFDGRWKSKKADKATTLAGYGITDAKIVNGTITLGSNSIMPLTSVPSHNQASNTITAMTGYSKPSSGSAIAASDSLNSAIGKLEAKVDAYDDSNYVHKTGDETVAGVKNFTNATISPIFVVSNPNFTKGTLPSAIIYDSVYFGDKNARGDFKDCIGSVESALNPTTNIISTWLKVRKNVPRESSSELEDSLIGVHYDGNTSEFYATAPSTLTTRNYGYDILTRDWIPKDTRIVHTTGAETISGEKTFSDNIHGNAIILTGNFTKAHPNIVKGTNPSSLTYWSIYFSDKNNGNFANSCIGQFETALDADGTVSTYIRAMKNEAGSSANCTISCIYDTANNVAKTWAPTPPTNDNSGQIATTNYVQNQNYVTKDTEQIITGRKAFTNVPYLLDTSVVTKHFNIEYSSIPDSSAFFMIGHADKNDRFLGRALWWWNASNIGGQRGFHLSIPTVNTETDRSMFGTGVSPDGTAYFWFGDHYSVHPNTDSVRLGQPATSHRWAKVYAMDTVISTSDERVKTDIDFVSEDILDAWDSIDWMQFRMKDAVSEKGEHARLHTGLIAQHIDSAFKSHNLDASRYGLFCYDEWKGEEDLHDDKGNVIYKGVKAGDIYSVRYEEALCMEAAWQRRENARLKKRIADLEERLAALELKVS